MDFCFCSFLFIKKVMKKHIYLFFVIGLMHLMLDRGADVSF